MIELWFRDPYTHVSSPVMIFLNSGHWRPEFLVPNTFHRDVPFATRLTIFGTDFAGTLFIPNSSDKIERQIPIDMPTLLATSLTIKRRPYRKFCFEQANRLVLMSMDDGRRSTDRL